MKTIAALMLFAVPAIAGDCHVQRNAVVLETGLVLTPFAVPVASPVSVVASSGVMYQATAQSQVNSPRTLSSDDEALFAEFLAWKRGRVQAAVVPQTAVQRACAKCHSGATPKGKLDLSGELTEKQRLASIAAVISGKMPKGLKLDPQLRADVVGELSGATNEGESK